jgi:hypothetical protein
MQYGYLLNKYLKCSVWRLAVRYDIYMSLGGKGLKEGPRLEVRLVSPCHVFFSILSLDVRLVCHSFPPVLMRLA